MVCSQFNELEEIIGDVHGASVGPGQDLLLPLTLVRRPEPVRKQNINPAISQLT